MTPTDFASLAAGIRDLAVAILALVWTVYVMSHGPP